MGWCVAGSPIPRRAAPRKKAIVYTTAQARPRPVKHGFSSAGAGVQLSPGNTRLDNVTSESPLGQSLDYPVEYSPEVLFPIDRRDTRGAIGIAETVPFSGVDIWNAWDLSWLDQRGRPVAATAEIRVPSDSSHIVESKSMKLYLGSLAMSRYESAEELAAVIAGDLGECTGTEIELSIRPLQKTDGRRTRRMPGESLDEIETDCDTYEIDAGLLEVHDDYVREDLYTNLFRSLCPVTGQPDIASVLVSYAGPRIERASLLRYLVSFRQHGDYHESCIERIYVDIAARCETDGLTVYARFQRRGGIDINPFRSDFESPPKNLRLWRQ